ncbi:MAG: hypothetical protein AMS20_00200 [Gemmatimonas sp. SG8_28]|nr:MAG: hypothetical protein AMS20_00200 [Gemmatimonas sp. SG8_28]
MELTPKQELFVRAYLKDLNATSAAIAAGYSPKTARAMGYENLTKPHIQEALADQLADMMARTGIEAQDVLEEIRRLAYSDMRDYVSWGPDHVTLVESSTLTEEQARAVKKVKMTETSTTVVQKDGSERTTSRTQVEFELHDKVDALTKLGQYLKLFMQAQDGPETGDERGVALLSPERPDKVLTFEH